MINKHDIEKHLEYRDGEMYWVTPTSFRVKAGSRFGTEFTHKGRTYRQGYLKGNLISEHRMVYLLHHGFLPKMIDHIDGNGVNNDINNLRECTPAQNNKNRGSKSNCVNKYKGVTFDKNSKKWKAQISNDGNYKYLGLHLDEESAARAYDSASKLLHADFGVTNRIEE